MLFIADSISHSITKLLDIFLLVSSASCILKPFFKFKTIDCKSKIVSSGKTQEKKQETGNTETETQETETQKQETEEFEKMFKKLDKFKFDIIVKYCEKKGYTVKKTVKVNNGLIASSTCFLQ